MMRWKWKQPCNAFMLKLERDSCRHSGWCGCRGRDGLRVGSEPLQGLRVVLQAGRDLVPDCLVVVIEPVQLCCGKHLHPTPPTYNCQPGFHVQQGYCNWHFAVAQGSQNECIGSAWLRQHLL